MDYAADVVHDSISKTLEQMQDSRDAEYVKYGDYYDGRPALIEKYFTRRHRETPERFADRPKKSWPFCRLISNTHAEALASGIKITLEDERAAEVWEIIAAHNDMPAFLQHVASISSVYGAAGVKPFLYDDGTKEKAIEFEAYPPDTAKFVYERNSAGRSVKRFRAVGISTGYSMENGDVLPAHLDPERAAKMQHKNRVEYITDKEWIVLLDEKPAPIGPFGEVWQPAEDGSNPFGMVMMALFNALETHEDFLGYSDLHHAIYDVQNINELWSDLVYMHRLYVPLLVLKSDNPDDRKAFKTGLGIGMNIGTGDDVKYAFGGVNFEAALTPIKVALEIMYSNAKVPAAAVGMGHLFRDQKASGVAKEYEYKPVISHATAKQPSFARGCKQMVRQGLTMASTAIPFGQGKGLDVDTEITVEYTGEIVPTSKADELERLGKEVLNGVTATYTAMIDYHGWSPARAQQEVDLKAAEMKAHLVDIGMKHIVDIVQDRQELTVTEAQKTEAAEVLFGATEPMEADVLADDKEVVNG